MRNLIAKLIANAVALWAASQLVEGISFGPGGGSIPAILIVAFLFGLINALIKPLIKLVTCPFYVLTLGLFTFIVNAAMLLLTSFLAEWLGQPFVVQSFEAAFWGSLVVTIVSFLLNIFLRERDEK